jgi:hypothetical protein
MRRSILAVVLVPLFLGLLATSAYPTTRYVSQGGGVLSAGTACNGQTAISVATFNGTSLSAGDTVFLCGTITSQVAPRNGGSSGNPVVLQWDTGASVRVCNASNGAVFINTLSFLTLDLGGNTTAVVCPNNGTTLGSQLDAIGIGSNGAGWNNVEIRNGTVGPMYVYSGTANNGFGSICISGANGTNNTFIHNVNLLGCAEGMEIDPTSNSTDEFAAITADGSVGRVLNYASGSGSNILLNMKFHDSNINYSSVWSVPGGFEHYEMIHQYNTGNGGSQDNVSSLIYNNLFTGISPTNSGSTALMFIGEGGSSCSASSTNKALFFNNVIVDTGNSNSGFSSGTGSYFYSQDCEHTLTIYNNTVVVTNGASNACFRAANGLLTNNNWIVKNNICVGANWAYFDDGKEPKTSDFNDFFNIGNGGWQWGSSSFSSLAAWSAGTGNDSHSISANPNLNGNFIPNLGSPVSGAGANLTSLGIAQLNVDKAGNARLATGNWDMGAFIVPRTLVNPASNLTAVAH